MCNMQSVDELAKLLRSCGLTDYSQHLLSMPRPKCVRALDICFSPSFNVGASEIDEVIGGGIYPGLLYEVVGPGGSGKTQFGLQCLLQSLIASPAPAISAYICTEKSVPMIRLRSLSSAFASRHSLNFDPLDRIWVHTARSFRELEGIVLTQLPSLSSRAQIPNGPIAHVSCVVIDSVCGFSRDLDEQWLGADAAQMRATALGRMAQVGLVSSFVWHLLSSCYIRRLLRRLRQTSNVRLLRSIRSLFACVSVPAKRRWLRTTAAVFITAATSACPRKYFPLPLVSRPLNFRA
jgi:hypothetical protein